MSNKTDSNDGKGYCGQEASLHMDFIASWVHGKACKFKYKAIVDFNSGYRKEKQLLKYMCRLKL